MHHWYYIEFENGFLGYSGAWQTVASKEAAFLCGHVEALELADRFGGEARKDD